MIRPIWASAMLRTAEKLAGVGAAPGRPALCDLRRATSTASYALFHQVTRHVVFAQVADADEDEVSTLARWLTHSGVRSAAESVLIAHASTSGRAPKKAEVSRVATLTSFGRSPVPSELLDVAEAFLQLQERRHEADYSNDFDPSRFATLGDIGLARLALTRCWSMWRARNSSRAARLALHESYRRFLMLALLDSGGSRTR